MTMAIQTPACTFDGSSESNGSSLDQGDVAFRSESAAGTSAEESSDPLTRAQASSPAVVGTPFIEESDTALEWLSGEWSVNRHGGFEFTIPFYTPGSRDGLRPEVGMVYDSSRGIGGGLGVGWGLSGTSKIHSCVTDHPAPWSPVASWNGVSVESETLCLDGAPLRRDRVYEGEHVATVRYAWSTVPDSQVRVLQLHADEITRLRIVDGSDIYSTFDAKLATEDELVYSAGGTGELWPQIKRDDQFYNTGIVYYLTEMADRVHGADDNVVSYEYEAYGERSEAQRLSNVTWGDPNEPFEVRVVYKPRPERADLQGLSSDPLPIVDLIDRVHVFQHQDGFNAYTYEFEYTVGAQTRLSRLSRARVCASTVDGTVTVPQLAVVKCGQWSEFEYSGNEARSVLGADPTVRKIVNAANSRLDEDLDLIRADGLMVLDVNGDGRDDLVWRAVERDPPRARQGDYRLWISKEDGSPATSGALPVLFKDRYGSDFDIWDSPQVMAASGSTTDRLQSDFLALHADGRLLRYHAGDVHRIGDENELYAWGATLDLNGDGLLDFVGCYAKDAETKIEREPDFDPNLEVVDDDNDDEWYVVGRMALAGEIDFGPRIRVRMPDDAGGHSARLGCSLRHSIYTERLDRLGIDDNQSAIAGESLREGAIVYSMLDEGGDDFTSGTSVILGRDGVMRGRDVGDDAYNNAKVSMSIDVNGDGMTEEYRESVHPKSGALWYFDDDCMIRSSPTVSADLNADGSQEQIIATLPYKIDHGAGDPEFGTSECFVDFIGDPNPLWTVKFWDQVDIQQPQECYQARMDQALAMGAESTYRNTDPLNGPELSVGSYGVRRNEGSGYFGPVHPFHLAFDKDICLSAHVDPNIQVSLALFEPDEGERVPGIVDFASGDFNGDGLEDLAYIEIVDADEDVPPNIVQLITKGTDEVTQTEYMGAPLPDMLTRIVRRAADGIDTDLKVKYLPMTNSEVHATAPAWNSFGSPDEPRSHCGDDGGRVQCISGSSPLVRRVTERLDQYVGSDTRGFEYRYWDLRTDRRKAAGSDLGFRKIRRLDSANSQPVSAHIYEYDDLTLFDRSGARRVFPVGGESAASSAYLFAGLPSRVMHVTKGEAELGEFADIVDVHNTYEVERTWYSNPIPGSSVSEEAFNYTVFPKRVEVRELSMQFSDWDDDSLDLLSVNAVNGWHVRVSHVNGIDAVDRYGNVVNGFSEMIIAGDAVPRRRTAVSNTWDYYEAAESTHAIPKFGAVEENQITETRDSFEAPTVVTNHVLTMDEFGRDVSRIRNAGNLALEMVEGFTHGSAPGDLKTHSMTWIQRGMPKTLVSTYGGWDASYFDSHATEITNPSGHVVHSRRDEFLGYITHFRYGDHDQGVNVRDLFGRPFQGSRESAGTVTHHHGPAQTGSELGTRKSVRISHSRGGWEQREYDGWDRIMRSVSVQFTGAGVREVEQRYRYDALGRVRAVSLPVELVDGVRPAGAIVLWKEFRYDGLGRVREVIEPDGPDLANEHQHDVEFKYNDLRTGWMAREYDGDRPESATVTGYDGRLLASMETDGTWQCYRYDAQGNLWKRWSIVETGRHAECDSGTVDVEAGVSTFVYDVDGNLVSSSTPERGAESAAFDASGALMWSSNAKGETRRFSYYADNRHDTTTTPEGATKYVWSDAFKGRLESIAWPGGKDEFSYDSIARQNGVSRTLTDAEDDDHVYDLNWTYDSLGRVHRMYYPRDPQFAGRVGIVHYYDAEHGTGALYGIARADEGEDVPQTMPAMSLSAAIWRANEVDHFGNLTAEEFGLDHELGLSDQTTRTFDNLGRLRSIVTADVSGGHLQHELYSYDSYGLLSRRSSQPIDGQLTYEDFLYDDRGRQRFATVSSWASGSPDMKQRETRYNRHGDITYRSETGAFAYEERFGNPRALVSVENYGAFGYDEAGRQISGPGRRISYDSYGNVDSVESDPVGAYEMYFGHTPSGETAFRYDAISGETDHYLSGVFERNFVLGDESVNDRKYKVIAHGRTVAQLKISQTVAPVCAQWDADTHYAVGDRVSYNGTVYISTTNVWWWPPDNVSFWEPSSCEGPGAMEVTREVLHRDRMNSVVVANNQAADALASTPGGDLDVTGRHFAFSSWGEPTERGWWADSGNVSESHTDIGFTGHPARMELGMVRMGSRFYDPTQGRFVSPDPFVPAVGSIEGWNRYAYAFNSPMNFIDPTGYGPELPGDSGDPVDGGSGGISIGGPIALGLIGLTGLVLGTIFVVKRVKERKRDSVNSGGSGRNSNRDSRSGSRGRRSSRYSTVTPNLSISRGAGRAVAPTATGPILQGVPPSRLPFVYLGHKMDQVWGWFSQNYDAFVAARNELNAARRARVDRSRRLMDQNPHNSHRLPASPVLEPIIQGAPEAFEKAGSAIILSAFLRMFRRGARARGCPGCPCFVAGTLVLMADGSYKAIEEIEQGDLVLADDPTDNESPRAYEVTATVASRTERLIEVNAELHGETLSLLTTGEHPFWVVGEGWTAADELTVGDVLQQASGETSEVASIFERAELVKTYNFSVAGVESYFVGSPNVGAVLVHNVPIEDMIRMQAPINLPESAVLHQAKITQSTGAWNFNWRWQENGLKYTARFHSPSPGALAAGDARNVWIVQRGTGWGNPQQALSTNGQWVSYNLHATGQTGKATHLSSRRGTKIPYCP